MIQIKIRAKINPLSGPICKDSIHGRYAEPNATDNAIGSKKNARLRKSNRARIAAALI